ncbi:LOW QUALITY PROTEIN: uncharacterized protein LOC116342968 [Contarinia nasturtii]|uniref:LOW QUALITY PROTEIN: uncharacterized protein LOC116342968 n=1 Tax=Contarinia nasturtii TaxID=265458 RepID=UPI0012D3822E|nr:LOW QUALITY PROTEIN: uncharacterized protein LOC116342968 [Contarinia nasturtii]
MATRKSRQNTESPTPSGTESVPTTPTTPATRNTRSIRNKQLQQGKADESIQIKSEKIEEEEEAVKETNKEYEMSTANEEITTPNNISDKVEAKETIEQNDKEKESSPPTTRKRRIAAAKEENAGEKPATQNNESISPNTTDDGKISPSRTKRSRRSACVPDTKPELTPSVLNKRRNSTGKIEKPTRKLSSRIKKLKQLRKTPFGRAILKKPEKITVAVNKPIKQLIEKQTATKGGKVEKSDSASDSELMKMSRRRSDSVSKCSDMTDASSFHETKGSVEDLLTQSSETSEGKTVVKEEIAEKDESAENKAPENEGSETCTRSVNDSGIGGDSDSSQAVKADGDQSNDGKRPSRFSLRKRQLNAPRVMNTRSRSETPSKTASEKDEDEEDTVSTKEIKKEAIESSTETPLQIDTVVSESNADEKLSPELREQTDKENVTDDKIKSVSPVLESEGVSEISVKQFYGRAEFLENNLGIEKDPKLGEIVQIQEKIKAGNKDAGDDDKKGEETEKMVVVVEENTETLKEDCVKSEKTIDITEPNEVHEVDTSTESMEIDEEDEEEDGDDKTDGAKCDDVKDVKDIKDSVDCFVKPADNSRRNSATILNENLLVLNGEIELTSKKEKKEIVKNMDEDVGEVVLFKISNGVRTNPEKLEKVLESQKLKEKERSNSTESTENGLTIEEPKIVENKETESIGDATKMIVDEKNTNKIKVKSDEPVRSNSIETKVIEVVSDMKKDSLIKPAAVRSNLSSKDSRSSSLDDESPEERNQKENHLKNLGLLTHQAAEEATIEKQKQREKLKEKNKGKKNSEYTGTLKTVIKLHRGNNDKKKGNQAIKLTLHKSKSKNGSDKSDSHSNANSEEDTYYTIQQQDIDGIDQEADEAAAKEHEKLLVIPEKASSFRYHPEKICEDQCFYCGGKFGLFDTPCHIAQIKSAERQKKILEYEEKLTVDSCLCDACFRHVDRRANCPSYKKRLSEPTKTNDTTATGHDAQEKDSDGLLFQSNREITFCQVHDCRDQASYSVCRKWALKVRKTLSKHIQFNFDNTNSIAFLPICDKHYEEINHLMVCILCNRRLKRNHCYFLSQDANKVESLVANEGIQLTVGTTSVACKLCRYYVNALMRPQEAKKVEFAREYRKRFFEHQGKVDMVEEDSEDSANHEPSSKRSKRNRKSLNDHSDSSKLSRSNDVSMDSNQDSALNTRTRQKSKQLSQQQLLEEQQRVEKRVQQEQLKLKQQELLQQQKLQEELRQQQLRSSNEDISNLRTNPNISMRELFPGEEEMGLHVNLPFANSWRTPDGWTKVTSTVQYDEPTRKLWEELQKPYGNQSSFLRHLLLLEKYFRNGDLLLTQNTNPNALNYVESVQHRLQAYDNIPSRPISITQILPQNTSIAVDLANAKSVTTANKAVTISKVNAPSKQPALSITASPKSNTSDNTSNSLLKSNATSVPKTRSYTVTTEPINGEKTESKGNNSTTNTNTPKNKNPGLPPELICITTPSEKQHASAVPPPSYALQMQLTLAQQIQQQHQNSLLLPQHTKQILQNMVPSTMSGTNVVGHTSSPPKKTTSNNNTSTGNSTSLNKSPNSNKHNTSTGKGSVIHLPEVLSDIERRESKNWRPTLMAITPENKNSSDGQLYQTADGRKLPYLVQVQSQGKPYMISIHDYNRLCILRRERLLKDQTELLKNKSGTTATQTTSSASQKTTATSANKKTVIDVDKLPKQTNNSNNGQITNKVQVPNKILEQNSLFPINNKSNENSSDSLLRFRLPIKNKSSLLKSNAIHPKASVASQHLPPNVTATVVASNSHAKMPISLPNALSQSNVVSITSTPSISALLGMAQASTPPPIQLIPNQPPPITITNVSTGNSNSSLSQSNVSSLEALFRTTNQVTTTPGHMFAWAEQLNKSNSITPIDNSASSILSKIPKSLTVIPQQKQLSKGVDEL